MKRNIMAIAMVMALYGCNSDKKGESADIQDNRSAASIPLSENTDTTTARIIKTADLRFRVKDAWKTKREISNQIRKYGGTIAESVVESKIEQKEKVRYSTDSLSEVTLYSTEGRIIARIPPEHLDQFTDDVAGQATFIDQQSILFDDQSIDYLANKARQQNRKEVIQLSAQKPPKKKEDLDHTLSLKDDLTDKKVRNLWIDDKVKMSTITLSFYQNPSVQKVITANDDLYDYRPGFGQRLLLGLNNGWFILKEFVLILANIWTLLVLGLAGFFGYRYYRKTRAFN